MITTAGCAELGCARGMVEFVKVGRGLHEVA